MHRQEPYSTATPHVVKAEAAPTVWKWLRERGGVAIWGSVNLSNPGASWTAPLNGEDGKPAPRPTWQAAAEPFRVITDPREVVVTIPREVARFRVAVRQSGNGLMLKVTDRGSERIRKAVRRASTPDRAAWHEFDYETQQAVIYVDDALVSLPEFMEKQSG